MTKKDSNYTTIASWNVNSINRRLPHVLDWLANNDCDVLALQETKKTDADFPAQEIRDAGYEVVFSGQKSYNGVAVISRQELTDTATEDDFSNDFEDRRILAVSVGDLRIIDLYVVNGQAPGTEKYDYKMRWLTTVHKFVKAQLAKYPNCIVLGDFNIAPTDEDLYDPKKFEGEVLCSPDERAHLEKFLALGLVDTFRLFSNPSSRFSWWDYRAGKFQKDHGARIDLVLASIPLAERCVQSDIDRTPRTWPEPSDHAPAYARFDLS